MTTRKCILLFTIAVLLLLAAAKLVAAEGVNGEKSLPSTVDEKILERVYDVESMGEKFRNSLKNYTEMVEQEAAAAAAQKISEVTENAAEEDSEEDTCSTMYKLKKGFAAAWLVLPAASQALEPYGSMWLFTWDYVKHAFFA